MPKVSSVAVLTQLVNSAGYKEIKQISGKKIAVLTSGNRVDVLKDINKKIKGSIFDKTPSSESSVGKVVVDGYSILAKPAGKQGGASPGVENETFVVDSITKLLKKAVSMNVVFTDGSNKYKIPNCIKVTSVGKDTSGRKKADIVLVNKQNRQFPISIKKDDAETWESADSYFGKEAEDIINKAVKAKKTKIVSQGSYYTIEPNIAVEATRQEKINVVFGSDLGQNGAVVTKTFSKDDFSIQGENIIITCSNIITDLSDVKGDKDVFFLIRNDKTRKSVPKYPGIRVLASYKKRINKNVVIVKR